MRVRPVRNHRYVIELDDDKSKPSCYGRRRADRKGRPCVYPGVSQCRRSKTTLRHRVTAWPKERRAVLAADRVLAVSRYP